MFVGALAKNTRDTRCLFRLVQIEITVPVSHTCAGQIGEPDGSDNFKRGPSPSLIPLLLLPSDPQG